MSGDGMTWYRRKPKLFLGGIRSLTERQIAVYTIVLDLIYLDGGKTDNNPKFIAGHIENLGQAAVRNTIEELVEIGKLVNLDGSLANDHALNEVKTHQKLRENSPKTEKKQPVFPEKSSENSNKNNEPLTLLDKSREEQKEAKASSGDKEKLVAECVQVGEHCTEIMGVTDDPRWLGNWSLVSGWLSEGFDPELDIYPTVSEIMERRRQKGESAPGTLKYFTTAIRRNFEARGGGKATAAKVPAIEVECVQRGSPEFRAWIQNIKAKGRSSKFSEGQDFLSVPADWLASYRSGVEQNKPKTGETLQ